MTLIFNGHSFKYETESLCRSFFPPQKLTLEYDTRPHGTDYIFTRRRKGKSRTLLYTTACLSGQSAHRAAWLDNNVNNYEKECERLIGVTLYQTLSALTGFSPGWGILTGVRPVKLLTQTSAADAQEKLLVTPEKFKLAMQVARNEAPILAQNTQGSFSLYVSIPFCPTRCAYCSFVSESIARAQELIPPYLELLHREIEAVGEMTRSLGLRLKTVYFGGGTPTTLTAAQLATLMEKVAAHFDIGDAIEYTMEAGRPDTIDDQKLQVIYNGGARRISINPQTMSDAVLAHIGRAHSAEQVLEAFAAARKAGFEHINMDLIAGLPTDTPHGFADTLSRVLALGPESVTVHTLTLKRSSSLFRDDVAKDSIGLVHKMVEHAQGTLSAKGYAPYYLYRQKNIAGGLENIGYAKPGYAGLYNVFIMSEAHTIVAVGAGGITKLVGSQGEQVKRIANHKFPQDYIRNFDEILARKSAITEFYCNMQ